MKSQNEAILKRLKRGPLTPMANGQTVVDVQIRDGRTKWLVRCFCGVETWCDKGSCAKRQSCGCMTREILQKARTTHGHSRSTSGRNPSPTFSSWKAMLDRCLPAHKSRSSYFDRGIKVCDRWQDFSLFLADMGERPEGTQLDRINNDIGYVPDNCHWTTPQENSKNRRSTRWLLVDGQRQTMSDWERIWKIPVDTIWRRLELGWDVADAVKRTRRQQKNLKFMP